MLNPAPRDSTERDPQSGQSALHILKTLTLASETRVSMLQQGVFLFLESRIRNGLASTALGNRVESLKALLKQQLEICGRADGPPLAGCSVQAASHPDQGWP